VSSKHFDGDLLEGKLAEDAFARILVSGREFWEHKRDRQCARTGNVAIEFETSQLPDGHGQRWPSGIAVCEAYWFVIEFAPERRLVVPTDAVKELARAAIRGRLHRWIGDDCRSHCALVPVDWFWSPPQATPTPGLPLLEAVM
jgi:hypothetical protein